MQQSHSDDREDRPVHSEFEYWERRYQEGRTGWELGEVAPPFIRLVEEGRFPPGRMAIPGAGRAPEPIFFAKKGFDVTAFEFAPSIWAQAREAARQAGADVTFECADILSLPAELSGHFDYVLEQTCFTCFESARRPTYVRTVHRLLKPGGSYFGLFLLAQKNTGEPPFPTDEQEIRSVFLPLFDIRKLQISPYSHPNRAGREYWGEFVRKEFAG